MSNKKQLKFLKRNDIFKLDGEICHFISLNPLDNEYVLYRAKHRIEILPSNVKVDITKGEN